jgi:hypothetical protein
MLSSRLLRPFRGSQGASLRISIADLAVYIFILLVGAFQFTHYTRTADLVIDATYPDLARSILEQGSYQVRFLPQTTLPPGFPLILALVGRFVGFAPAILFRVIVVSATFGLFAAYELLRRIEGRGLAAAACLLFGSSPALFSFNTNCVFAEMPFFLASMLALLLALKVDHAEPGRSPIVSVLLLSIAVVVAVLIRSVGIALLIGLGTWSVTSLLTVPEIGRRRVRRFSIPLVLGLAVQLSWSVWAQRHQILEWQLPGYPESYVSQLKVKNGQNPELGMAHLGDIPRRVGQNLVTRAVRFGELLTRRYISKFWSSPAISGVLILIVIGLASSLRAGGHLHDWYFLWYETIFLLWPWQTKDRFLFPIIPLACLYLWRGVKKLKEYSIHEPKATGFGLVLLGSFLSLSSAAFAFRITAFAVDMDHRAMDYLQPVAATLFWVALTATGFGMLRFRSLPNSTDVVRPFAHLSRLAESETPPALRFVTILAVAALVGSGVLQQVARGRDNMNPDITQVDLYPEIEAAQWIRTYESSDKVIMAREPEFVFHYTHRRVVWFPPISDPKVLMDGIRRHQVEVVVVAHHADSYWLPPEEACFQTLLQAYGSVFHLSHRGPDNWVYEVAPPQDGG